MIQNKSYATLILVFALIVSLGACTNNVKMPENVDTMGFKPSGVTAKALQEADAADLVLKRKILLAAYSDANKEHRDGDSFLVANQLGKLELQDSNYQGAEPYYVAMENICDRTTIESNALIPLFYPVDQLTEIYRHSSRRREEELLLKKIVARQQAEKTFQQTSFNSLDKLASFYLQNHELEKARVSLEELLRLRSDFVSNTGVLRNFSEYANCLISLKKETEAIAFINTQIELIERQLKLQESIENSPAATTGSLTGASSNSLKKGLKDLYYSELKIYEAQKNIKKIALIKSKVASL